MASINEAVENIMPDDRWLQLISGKRTYGETFSDDEEQSYFPNPVGRTSKTSFLSI